jgi:hypothetical protein
MSDEEVFRRYVYIAGEFDKDIATVFSIIYSGGCSHNRASMIQDNTNLTIFNEEGANIRQHLVPYNEINTFTKDQCPNPDFYRVFVCKDKLIIRWFDHDKVLFINLYHIRLMGPFLQRSFIKQLYRWKYNFRNHTLKDVRFDSLNLFGCEKDGSFYFYTPRPRTAVRYFKR